MAKKKAEETINLDAILFKCRDILRNARNSGSFFEKRDMMLTLVSWIPEIPHYVVGNIFVTTVVLGEPITV